VRRFTLIAAGLVLALGLAGCGDDDTGGTVSTETEGSAATSTAAPSTAAPTTNTAAPTTTTAAPTTTQVPRPEPSLWLSNAGTGDLVNYDLETGEELGRAAIGGSSGSIGFGFGSVWVGDFLAGTITRVDAETYEILATITVPGQPSDVIGTGAGIWVSLWDTGQVVGIDPDTNEVVLEVDAGQGMTGMVAGSLYAGSYDTNSVFRLSYETLAGVTPTMPYQGTSLLLPGSPSELCRTNGHLFASHPSEGLISVVDTGSFAVAAEWNVGGAPNFLKCGSGFVATSDGLAGSIRVFDAATGSETSPAMQPAPAGIAVRDMYVFAVSGSGGIYRYDYTDLPGSQAHFADSESGSWDLEIGNGWNDLPH